MTKAAEQTRARELRAEGAPYRRIADQLEVSVGSVHRWTRDIELTAGQVQANLRGPSGPLNPDRVRLAAATWAARCRARRAEYQADGRKRARRGDMLHQAGCMLYWAEGAKSRNQVKFANSDPQMVLLFRRFLTDALAINPFQICLSINAYTNNGLAIDEIEEFWLDLLGLPRCSVRKHTLNQMPTSSSGRAKKRLRYGVCFLVVNSTSTVQHIFGAIQEYAGFEEPRWLD